MDELGVLFTKTNTKRRITPTSTSHFNFNFRNTEPYTCIIRHQKITGYGGTITVRHYSTHPYLLALSLLLNKHNKNYQPHSIIH
jgi:hypothetical protein